MFSSLRWLILLCVLFGAADSQAYLTVGEWQPLFKGVDHATGDTDEPRLQKVNAIRVDLQDPDIQLITTPGNGALPGDTTRQTASSYIAQTDVQVAINGQYIHLDTGYPYGDLVSLAMHEGQIVSPAEKLYGVNPGTLLVTQDNVARIEQISPWMDLPGVWTAIESWAYLLVDGVNEGDPRVIPGNVEPRSAVGLSQDGRYLTLMTIDGRQQGYSEGATSFEESEWLKRFGAYNGINLDGGGSTHLWVSEHEGETYAVNRPTENRPVSNHLGIYAASLESIIDGDFDLDNDVDGADFLTWQRDPSVGTLAEWEANYGSGPPLSAASAVVPEPSAVLLVMMASLIGISFRHHS